MQRMLNVGCGSHFHKSWVNIDINPVSEEVRAFDVKKGLPFVDGEFDAVYSSHVLEHLTRKQGQGFLMEMYRVLKRDGVIRIVVPDLEAICRLYLEKLELVRSGDDSAKPDYEWMRLELFDQIVRDVGGGEMLGYLLQKDIQNKNFVVSRIGQEAESIWSPNKASRSSKPIDGRENGVFEKLKKGIKNRVLRYLCGPDVIEAIAVGQFRASGEVHRFMYDEYSCRLALHEAGFVEAVKVRPDESRITSFSEYYLDVLEDGSIRKPDSIFIEAVKGV